MKRPTGLFLDVVRCPLCAATVRSTGENIQCGGCGQEFPALGEIPVILRDAPSYLQSCRQQLALVEQHAARTIRSIEEQMRLPDLTPATRARCVALIDAIRDQSNDIREVLRPVIGANTVSELAAEEFPAPLHYIHYLYRDWGWPPEANGENERAFAMTSAMLAGRPPQRMLVIGAGACRLAYDLHRLDGSGETLVIDIDAFLFSAARRVIHGESLSMREVNAEVNEVDSVARHWALKAPAGPINDRFHFLICDGVQPPLASEAFDTVVTPWFIDVVPADLRNFISEVYRLLKPGGRWINLGPLRYRQDIPITRRFTREEVFDLAVRAGFVIDRWETQSVPYLVSKLNGRGKTEWVLSFGATRRKSPEAQAGDTPPSWVLFIHVAIPRFADQEMFQTEDPAEQIVLSAIDGRNTLDDIASILASHAGDSGLTMDQFREIVRRCLMVIHPACRSDR